MVEKKPLANYSGSVDELHAGDTIEGSDVSYPITPDKGGTGVTNSVGNTITFIDYTLPIA